MERRPIESRGKRFCKYLSLLARQFLLILGKNFLLQVYILYYIIYILYYATITGCIFITV